MSFRSRNNLAARCVDYEFEDVITSIDEVDMITIEQGFAFSPRKRIVNQLTRHVSPSFSSISPSSTRVSLKKNYDVFIAVCQDVTDVLMVNSIRNWKQRSGVSICWIDEFWAASLIKNRHLCDKLLTKFDYIFLGCSGSVNALQEEIQKPCQYIPPGVDAIKFAPVPNRRPRDIDIYSIGRRPSLLHDQLLGMVRTRNIKYLYDKESTGPLFVADYRNHRKNMVDNLQRSKYFIVYPAKFDAPKQTHQQVEFGPRYFEGAAAGAILIGQPAASDAFSNIFDWEDVVIELPEKEAELVELFDRLENDPVRMERISNENIRQCLSKHDWLYRWQEVLGIVGVDPCSRQQERLRELRSRIDAINNENISKTFSESRN